MNTIECPFCKRPISKTSVSRFKTHDVVLAKKGFIDTIVFHPVALGHCDRCNKFSYAPLPTFNATLTRLLEEID